MSSFKVKKMLDMMLIDVAVQLGHPDNDDGLRAHMDMLFDQINDTLAYIQDGEDKN